MLGFCNEGLVMFTLLFFLFLIVVCYILKLRKTDISSIVFKDESDSHIKIKNDHHKISFVLQGRRLRQ